MTAPDLPGLGRELRPCCVEPIGFMVAWSGVLALRFAGFPPQLVRLKELIEENFGGLCPEGSGSKFPKSTLAALRAGKRLDPDQLQRLQQVCDLASARLAAAKLRLQVSALSLVTYENRALERRLGTLTVPLGAAGATVATSEVDEGFPAEEQLKQSSLVFQETLDPGYWVHASRDGNREPHYRDPAPGATLVWDFGKISGSKALDVLMQELATFAREVEAALPGQYCFFEPSALHMTVRALKA